MRPRKPSPALVISMMALFVALSGVAMALERNSVRSRHILDGAIQNKDLTDDVIFEDNVAPPLARDGSQKVGPEAIDQQEIAANAVDDDEIATSAVGDSELGNYSVGAADLDNVNLVPGTATTITDADGGDENWTGDTASVGCDDSEQLLSGYGEWTDASGSDDTAIAEMIMNPDSGNVVVRGIQNSGASKNLRAVAVCLDD